MVEHRHDNDFNRSRHRSPRRRIPHQQIHCFENALPVALIDTSEKNGSFELLPGTQYLAVPSLQIQYNDILETGDADRGTST